uniref:Uncharacterized protein n=1 Tax=Nelumbo nucifera TaxID=4432 RepID=A0A822XPY9_NELNU|nr:TPA_asm: hypothetical protein HUJ06_023860 [Nelumbo nucifera]
MREKRKGRKREKRRERTEGFAAGTSGAQSETPLPTFAAGTAALSDSRCSSSSALYLSAGYGGWKWRQICCRVENVDGRKREEEGEKEGKEKGENKGLRRWNRHSL